MFKHSEQSHTGRLHIEFPSGSRAGERYSVDLSFCPNPICTCANAELSLYRDISDELEESNAEFHFEVDLLERNLSTPTNDAMLSVYDRNIGQDFVEQVQVEDWLLLWAKHFKFKQKITRETPDKELLTHFPAAEIEASGLLISVTEILPFAEDIQVNLDGSQYLFDDSYCLREDCKCTNAFVTLFDEKIIEDANGQDLATIRVDYRSAKWELIHSGEIDAALLKLLAGKLVSERSRIQLEDRHNHLRRLYQLYRRTHHTPVQLSSPKVGRNQPCPCGSGKKYKKCCMTR